MDLFSSLYSYTTSEEEEIPVEFESAGNSAAPATGGGGCVIS